MYIGHITQTPEVPNCYYKLVTSVTRAVKNTCTVIPIVKQSDIPQLSAFRGQTSQFIITYICWTLTPGAQPLYLTSEGMPLSHLPPLNLQVTGGSSGIGKSIAMECYRQGAFITLVARDEVSRNKIKNINVLDSFALFFTQTAHLSSLSFYLE